MKAQVATLQEAVLHELEGAVERLKKVQKSEDSEDLLTNFQRAVSAQPDSEKAEKSAEWLGTGSQDLRPIRRPDKRRWTTSMAGIGGALTPSCLVTPLEDADTPATSTVVSAAASEVASDNSDSPPMSRRTSLRDGSMKQPRKASRITFEGQLHALDTPGEEDEDLQKEAGSDTSSIGKKSDASSMNWRADALDVGENLAAEAAAKKGHMSVDSIVALVQEERERWEEERQALELRVEELKLGQRWDEAVHSPDAEKRALKVEQQELRKVIKARSRFGAWVCEKHMVESDDEETDGEKEEFGVRFRAPAPDGFTLCTASGCADLNRGRARAAAGAGSAISSESDASPIRRNTHVCNDDHNMLAIETVIVLPSSSRDRAIMALRIIIGCISSHRTRMEKRHLQIMQLWVLAVDALANIQMSFQRLWTCLQGFSKLSRSSESSVDVSNRQVKVGNEDHVEAHLDKMINEVLHTEVGKLQTTFSQHLREYEVALSQFRPENGHERSWARQDLELLRQQVQLMERQRRQRNLEVGKLRKAMREVRNALFVETPAAAQGHLAAQQLLDEVRTERERRLAEKHYLEDQIKKLKSEVEELEEGQAATPAFDHEKEKLKASVRQLKMSIESKDRYACWVCNRAHERQDESAEGSDAGEDSDKHDECVMMRRRLVEMEEEIRELTGEGGTRSHTASHSSPKTKCQTASQSRSVAERFDCLAVKSRAEMSDALEQNSWISGLLPDCPMSKFHSSIFSGSNASTVAEASVQFSDSVSAVTSLEVPENVPEVGNRSVRDRILTPFVAANVTASEDRRALLAPVLSTVEEFEAQSSRERLRSSRDRMPTPHVSSEMIEEAETYAASGKTVRIFPAADMEAIPASGRRRPSRERQATPFVKEEDMPPNDTRTVQFSGAVST
ncbi:PRKG2, partial [Symbiodinium sp. CCMP2456]